jgi:hypothetical protein
MYVIPKRSFMRYRDGLPPSEYNLPPGCSQRDCEGSGISDRDDMDNDPNPYDFEEVPTWADRLKTGAAGTARPQDKLKDSD